MLGGPWEDTWGLSLSHQPRTAHECEYFERPLVASLRWLLVVAELGKAVAVVAATLAMSPAASAFVLLIRNVQAFVRGRRTTAKLCTHSRTGTTSRPSTMDTRAIMAGASNGRSVFRVVAGFGGAALGPFAVAVVPLGLRSLAKDADFRNFIRAGQYHVAWLATPLPRKSL